MADLHFANVVLLCRFDTAIVDESNSAHTLTVTGSPSISSAQSVAGGSSLQHATTNTNRTNLITTPVSTDFSFDGDFTVELWVYPTGQGSTYMSCISTAGSDAGIGAFQFGRRDTGQILAYVNQSSYSPGTSTAGALNLNEWTHLCLERDGSTIRIYRNGAQTATLSGVSATVGLSQLEIGAGDVGSTNRDWRGYIDELRVTKGVARYKGSSFTPPSGDGFLPSDTEPSMGEARTTALYREAMTADDNVATTVTYREVVSSSSSVASTAGYRETLLSRAEPASTSIYRETLYSRAEPASTAIYREIFRTTRDARTGLRKRSASLQWDTLIELIEVDVRTLNPDFIQEPGADKGYIRLSPNWSGNDLSAVSGKPVWFRGLPFWPSACAAEGFSWSIRDQLPRPTITIADMDGVLLSEADRLDDLVGARVSVWMTDINFLNRIPGTDDPADPGSGDAYGPEVYLINKLLMADGFQLQWELIAELDQPTAILPGRRMFRRDYPGLARQQS